MSTNSNQSTLARSFSLTSFFGLYFPELEKRRCQYRGIAFCLKQGFHWIRKTLLVSQMTSTTTKMINIFTPKRARVLRKVAAGAAVSSIPVLAWWKWSLGERQKRAEDVRTRVRVPNVQSIDDLMIERCRPGDVLLFDRKWENCATGPLAALVCILGRKFLCSDDPNKVIPTGKFDHCGM